MKKEKALSGDSGGKEVKTSMRNHPVLTGDRFGLSTQSNTWTRLCDVAARCRRVPLRSWAKQPVTHHHHTPTPRLRLLQTRPSLQRDEMRD